MDGLPAKSKAVNLTAVLRSPTNLDKLRAFSGKVDTGFPPENATNKEQLERFPIQPDREAL
jgi:hypothetical protein